MAVFEDKFRPDMEVCKSLQFYSLSDDLSRMLDICELITDSSKVWRVLLLLVGMLFGTGSVFAGKTGYSGKLHFGVALPGSPSALGEAALLTFSHWPLGCLVVVLTVNVWQCRMFSYALSQCLKTTGFLTKNRVCMSVHPVPHTWPENEGSLKNPLERSASGRGWGQYPVCRVYSQSMVCLMSHIQRDPFIFLGNGEGGIFWMTFHLCLL